MSDNDSSITTIEELAEYFMEELTGLKNQLAATNALVAAQSAASIAPLVAQPVNKTPIRKPTTASRMKKPIVAAILDHLLEDTKFAFTEVLKKVSVSNSLPLPRNDGRLRSTTSSPCGPATSPTKSGCLLVHPSLLRSCPPPSKKNLSRPCKTCAAKYNLHISRCEGSWMAKALLKEKFAHHAQCHPGAEEERCGGRPWTRQRHRQRQRQRRHDDSDKDNDAEEQQQLMGFLLLWAFWMKKKAFLMLHPERKRARMDSSSPSSLGRTTTASAPASVPAVASASVSSSFSASASAPVSSSSPPPSPAYASGSADSGPGSV